MKRNVWKILFFSLIGLILVSAITFGIGRNIFFQDSLHVIGKRAQVSVFKNCYFYDASGEIVDQSLFRASAYISKDEDFVSMTVEDYPVGKYAGRWDNATIGEAFIYLSNQGVTTHEDWECYYQVNISRDDPDIVHITIFLKDGSTLNAICADSEEEAKANLQRFWELYPNGD